MIMERPLPLVPCSSLVPVFDSSAMCSRPSPSLFQLHVVHPSLCSQVYNLLKFTRIYSNTYPNYSFISELTAGCDRQVSWIKDQTLVDQTNANNIEQGRVQFSIVEAGPRDSGLYELLTVYNGEEHRAAFAINVL